MVNNKTLLVIMRFGTLIFRKWTIIVARPKKEGTLLHSKFGIEAKDTYTPTHALENS